MKRLKNWLFNAAVVAGAVMAPSVGLAEGASPTLDSTAATAIGTAFADGFKTAINDNASNFTGAALAAGIVFVILMVIGIVIKIIKRVAGR